MTRPDRSSRAHKSARSRKRAGDRALIALANALLAFATGCIVWLLLFQVLSGMLNSAPPFMPVIFFALLMGVLSFVLEIDFILRIFSRIWRLLGQLFSKLF